MALPLILIVDDNPENLTVLGELLQPDYAVRVANSGVRALRLARLQPLPELVLLDVMMPEMDGFEVLRQLRARPETAAIPVVFLTALTDTAEQQRGLRQGAAAFVTKPVEPDLLLAQVRQLLAAGPGAPPSPHALRIGQLVATLARQLAQAPGLGLPANAKDASDASDAHEGKHGNLGLTAGACAQLARQVAGQLQEHWDGSGYPAGLAGEAIPLAVRLWAVADAWDRLALPGLSPGQRQQAMLAQRGRRLDPAAVDALIANQGAGPAPITSHG